MKFRFLTALLMLTPTLVAAEPSPTANLPIPQMPSEVPILATDWGFTLQLKSLETGGLGLDYVWIPMPNARNGKGIIEKSGAFGGADWSLLAEIKAEGFLAFDSDDVGAASPKALNIEGNLFTNIIAAEVAGQDWWVDVGLSAIQLEADQQFDRINYVLRPYLVTPVPGSHLLSGFIHKLFRVPSGQDTSDGGFVPRSDRPIYLRAGYGFVSTLNDDGNPSEDRLELGASWRIGLYRDSTFDVSYRYFIEESKNYGFLDLTLSIPLKKDIAVLVKYVDGELPTSLGAAQSVSAGFSISF